MISGEAALIYGHSFSVHVLILLCSIDVRRAYDMSANMWAMLMGPPIGTCVPNGASQPGGRYGSGLSFHNTGVAKYLLLFGGFWQSCGYYSMSDLWAWNLTNSTWFVFVSFCFVLRGRVHTVSVRFVQDTSEKFHV